MLPAIIILLFHRSSNFLINLFLLIICSKVSLPSLWSLASICSAYSFLTIFTLPMTTALSKTMSSELSESQSLEESIDLSLEAQLQELFELVSSDIFQSFNPILFGLYSAEFGACLVPAMLIEGELLVTPDILSSAFVEASYLDILLALGLLVIVCTVSLLLTSLMICSYDGRLFLISIMFDVINK